MSGVVFRGKKSELPVTGTCMKLCFHLLAHDLFLLFRRISKSRVFFKTRMEKQKFGFINGVIM